MIWALSTMPRGDIRFSVRETADNKMGLTLGCISPFTGHLRGHSLEVASHFLDNHSPEVEHARLNEEETL